MTRDPSARIVETRAWGDYFLFRIDSEATALDAKPGQFLMVRVGDSPDPLLRRPFSIHSREQGSLEIFFKVAGHGTTLLAQKKPGDRIDILGPLGKGFSWGGGIEGKTVFLVGGGRGIAPLYFLATEIRTAGIGIRILYGGRNLGDIPLEPKFRKAGFDILCSTDDGTCGFRGLVTGLLQKEIENRKPFCIFVCGPDSMMRKTAEISAREKIPAQFSLESIMGCGFGACWGCVKRIRQGQAGTWRKICEDGPVFWGEDILWDEEG